MELHHWPVREGIVASPEVYPWSSDKISRQSRYQQIQSNAGLACHRMLQRLAKQRFNSPLCYERMMEQFQPWSIENATNRLYQALASDAYITLYLRGEKPTLAHTTEQIKDMRHKAENLICDILGVPVEQIRHPRFRRQYYQVEPLTLWLLLQSQCGIKQLTFIFDLDQTIIEGWMRSIPNLHPESLLTKIQQRWQEKISINESQVLSPIS